MLRSIARYLAVLVLLLVYSSLGMTSDLIQINRYQRLNISHQVQEKDLLSAVVEIKFPASIKTIGKAINTVLETSGYKLDVHSKDLSNQHILLELPLPDSYRDLSPRSLRNLLGLLAGEAYTLRVNPVHREIGFVLKEEYSQYVNHKRVGLAQEEVQAKKPGKQKPQVSDTATQEIQYGPVKEGETLTEISKKLPLSWLTLDQQLVALFKANSHAFSDNNMNHLIIGAFITLPTLNDIVEIPPKEATVMVDEHEARWKTLNLKG